MFPSYLPPVVWCWAGRVQVVYQSFLSANSCALRMKTAQGERIKKVKLQTGQERQ